MWAMVLVFGFGMAIDPVRLGIAVTLLSRRRPLVNLLAFWVGGMTTAVGLGIAVLLLLHDSALVAIRAANSVINDVRSEVVVLAGGRLQITVGVIFLLLAARMVARDRARMRAPVGVGEGAGGPALAVAEPRRGVFGRLGARTHQMLNCDVVWPAFVVGLGSSVPPYEGVVVLTFIMASRAGLATQFTAFVVFTLLVLTVIEIPLVAYLAMPQKTELVMLRFQDWVQLHRRQISMSILIGVGCLCVYQGVAAL